MHHSRSPVWLFLSTILLTGAIASQSGTPAKSSTDQKGRTVRVGISMMSNQSRRSVSPKWERDQLVRNLRGLRTDRKSAVTIEAVPLEARSREDAGPEAAQKSCQYYVLTTLLDVGHGPGVSVGPDGVHPSPVILGNPDPSGEVAMEFSIFEVGETHTLAEGTAVGSNQDGNETRAADEALRTISLRVASELRKERSPNID
jgi:hypothetical protein